MSRREHCDPATGRRSACGSLSTRTYTENLDYHHTEKANVRNARSHGRLHQHRGRGADQPGRDDPLMLANIALFVGTFVVCSAILFGSLWLARRLDDTNEEDQ